MSRPNKKWSSGTASSDNTSRADASEMLTFNETTKTAAREVQAMKRIDYVIVYAENANKTNDAASKGFIQRMKEQGLKVFPYEAENPKRTFLLVHCPFGRLCQEATRVQLHMPLESGNVKFTSLTNCFDKCMAYICKPSCQPCENDRTIVEVSASFDELKLNDFKGSDSEDEFFRPALRSFLVHSILDQSIADDGRNDYKTLDKRGLSELISEKLFSAAFPLPYEFEVAGEDDGSCSSGARIEDGTTAKKWPVKRRPVSGTRAAQTEADLRRRFVCSDDSIDITRDRFGEETAFYVAWSSMLFWSLIPLAIWGLALSIAGVAESLNELNGNETSTVGPPLRVCSPSPTWSFFGRNGTCRISNGPLFASYEHPLTFKELSELVDDFSVLALVGVDTASTWWFGIVVSIWGTITVAVWRWRRAALATRWQVDRLKIKETTRPQFSENANSNGRRVGSFFANVGLLILSMLGVGLVILFNFLRVIISKESHSVVLGRPLTIFLNLLTLLANTVITLGASKLIQWLSYEVNKLENHMTQSAYKHSLILKMLAFTAMNEYAPLFYVALFQGNFEDYGFDGFFGMGPEYMDNCDKYGSCFPQLSMQLIITALVKCTSQFRSSLFKTCAAKCCRKSGCGKPSCTSCWENIDNSLEYIIETEIKKESAESFIREGYLEEVIVFGHIVIFSCVAPLAPVAFVISFIASSDLNNYLFTRGQPRMPVAQPVDEIGIWSTLIESLNVIGIVTTAFLVTSLPSAPSAASEPVRLLSTFFYVVIALLMHFIFIRFLPEFPTYVKIVRLKEQELVSQRTALAAASASPA